MSQGANLVSEKRQDRRYYGVDKDAAVKRFLEAYMPLGSGSRRMSAPSVSRVPLARTVQDEDVGPRGSWRNGTLRTVPGSALQSHTN